MLQPARPQQVYDPYLPVRGNNSREEMFEIPLNVNGLFGKSLKHLEEMVVYRVTAEQVL